MSLRGRLSALLLGRQQTESPPAGLPTGPISHPAVPGLAHVTLHGHTHPTGWVRVVLAVAVGLLAVFVVADVGAYMTDEGTSHVTAVSWYAEGVFLSSSGGFAVHASKTLTLTITCDFICYNFNSASVSAPFHLVSFSVVNQPIQYTNVTIRAPASGYTGPLSITLGLP